MGAADVVGAREVEFDVVAELVRDHVLIEFIRVFGEVREQRDVLGTTSGEKRSVGLAAPIDDERGEAGGGDGSEDGLYSLVDRIEHRERSGGACAGGDAGGADAGGNGDVVRVPALELKLPGSRVGVGRVPRHAVLHTHIPLRTAGAPHLRDDPIVMVVLLETVSV